MENFKYLFSPAKIGNLEIKNRIVMASMATGYAYLSGEVTERQLNYYRARAAGGVGLIVVEAAVIDDPAGREGFGQIRIDHPQYISGLQRLADNIKAYNCGAFIQLFHAGRQTTSLVTGGITPVAPSALSCKSIKEMPRELSHVEIKNIIDKFVRGACFAYKAGFDGVELHAAHGYLLNQFLSAQSNQRTDEYGGCLENRTRILAQVCRKIKSQVPELALSVRLNIDDFTRDGLKIAETEFIAKMLEQNGVDIINCSSGIYESGLNCIEPASYEDGWRIYLAAAIKKKVAIPVIAGGMVRKPAMAEQIIAEKQADFVFIGRSMLADSQWANKARRGDSQAIRPCIICNNCISSHFKGFSVSCTVNPATGREVDFARRYHEDLSDCRVIVAGGGPAGMQAAIALRKRGMAVTLYEKGLNLGGMLNLAMIPPHKERIGELKEYLIRQLHLSGAEIITGKSFEAEDFYKNRPNFLVVATGSKARKPNIEGWDDEFCFLPEEIFKKPERIKNCRIVIIGGGNIGCELADFLNRYNNRTVIVEEKETIASNMERKNRRALLERLHYGQAILFTRGRVKRIEPGRVAVDINGETEKLIPADLIIAAVGFEADNNLLRQLSPEAAPFVFTIGDAWLPAGIKAAILQGEMLADSLIRQSRQNNQAEKVIDAW